MLNIHEEAHRERQCSHTNERLEAKHDNYYDHPHD
jgi:hypothetical protein